MSCSSLHCLWSAFKDLCKKIESLVSHMKWSITRVCLAYCAVFFGSQVKRHPVRLHNALSLLLQILLLFLSDPFHPVSTKTKNVPALLSFSPPFFSSLKVWQRCSPALPRRAGSSVLWAPSCCCCLYSSSSASSRGVKEGSIQASAMNVRYSSADYSAVDEYKMVEASNSYFSVSF